MLTTAWQQRRIPRASYGYLHSADDDKELAILCILKVRQRLDCAEGGAGCV